MRFLPNMNMPRALGRRLAAQGRGCRQVGGVGMGQVSDAAIIEEARANNCEPIGINAAMGTLTPTTDAPPMEELETLEFALAFCWGPVLRSSGEEYLFPQPATEFMRQQYSGAAVYAWSICRRPSTLHSPVYIGTSKKLCPGGVARHLAPRL